MVVSSVPDYFVGWVFVVPVQRIVRVLELAGAVMEELGNSQGPRTDAVGAHCREFMLAMKVTSLLRSLVTCLPVFLGFPLLRLNPRRGHAREAAMENQQLVLKCCMQVFTLASVTCFPSNWLRKYMHVPLNWFLF